VQTTVPVVEEELEVGKRTVERGGVRVHSHVEEMPIEEVVRLREEHVNIERRPVDRPVSGTDPFQEVTVEVKETAEEPVVVKQARVVEEVVIDKQTEVREETIEDTIRRQEVEVEQLPKTGTGGRR
jgi:stress response protein YsnF